MTVRSESRAEIAGSVGNVWGYLTDVSRWPDWAAAILECRVSGGGQLAAGAHLEQRVNGMFGSTRARELDVSAVDAERRLAFTGAMGPSRLRWGFDLTAIDADRTDLNLWVEVELQSLMRAVPGGVLRILIRRVNERELIAIKSAVESTQHDELGRAPRRRPV